MSRPGNKLLQFVSSSVERGKTERVGEKMVGHPCQSGMLDTADSLWSSSHIHAHRRKDGTFNNGPRFEVSETLAHAVFTVVFVVGLAASCMWFYHTFLEAEPAIIHSISSKGGK